MALAGFTGIAVGAAYHSLKPVELWSHLNHLFVIGNPPGGPSGSGKTSLARKMANIVGCEVVSLESYHRSEQVKDFKYEDFRSLDLTLLSKDSPIRVPVCTSRTVS
ncbi:hypothetical protein AgCh_007685 [Apium graveolens]